MHFRVKSIARPVSGTIADVFKVSTEQGEYCLRVRTRNARLQFSKKQLQEPSAYKAVFLGKVTHLDDLKCPASGNIDPVAPWLLRIFFYDSSRERLPEPWITTPWVDGPNLWALPLPELYLQAGGIASAIHKVQSAIVADDLSGPAGPASTIGAHILRRIQALLSKLRQKWTPKFGQ